MSLFGIRHLPSIPNDAQVWLLHGVFADHRLWQPVIDGLDGLTAAALDGPGHGTVPRPDPLPSLAAQTDLLAELIQAHAPGGVVLGGHSWGGMLGLRLATTRPDLVRALLLTNTPLLRLRGTSRMGFHLQRAILGMGLPAETYGRRAAAALYGQAYRRQHPEVVSEAASIVGRLGRRGTRQIIDQVLLAPNDTVDLVAALPMPTIVAAGADDYVAPAAVRTRLARAGLDMQIHPGGHMGPREAPDVLADLLKDLVQRSRRHLKTENVIQ